MPGAGAPLNEHGLDGRFCGAQAVADAVCYEGYVLYPYRASAVKNRFRWQFGVLAPAALEASGTERSSARAEVIVEAQPGARLHVRVRALHVQERSVFQLVDGHEVPVAKLDDGDQVWTSFDEAVEWHLDVAGVALGTGSPGENTVTVRRVAAQLPGATSEEPIAASGASGCGRVVRRRRPVDVRAEVDVTPLSGPEGLVRVGVTVANDTDWAGPAGTRDEVLRRSLVSAHLLVAVDGGRPLSSLDPPPYAARAVAGCANSGLFPVLVGEGESEVVLASPILLYDHPAVAPESQGDMFDATEIDEILALRVRTLTEQEKREARGTDARAAAVVDRCDAMDAETLGALHGTFRPTGGSTAGPTGDGAAEPVPWWDPDADAAVDPWSDTVEIAGKAVGNGTRVRLRPRRRADAQDLFVDGRTATVAGVLHDVGGDVYLAVTVDDPDADLHAWHGRYLYFSPDEVELLAPDEPELLAAAEPELLAAAEPELLAAAEVEPQGAEPRATDGSPPRRRVLVAGVGNIFFGDDGFGVEVVNRLDSSELPADVKVSDFGIRGVHLAYELLDGYDVLVLIDAVSRGAEPGTVSLLEHVPGADEEGGTLAAIDAHGMNPGAVLAMAADLGARVERVLVLGCEAGSVAEGIGLSPAVAGAVPAAIDALGEMLTSLSAPAPAPAPGEESSRHVHQTLEEVRS